MAMLHAVRFSLLCLVCFLAFANSAVTPEYATRVTSDGEECGLTVNGHNFSFSALTLVGDHYSVVDNEGHYLYEFNVCGVVGSPASPNCTGAACQYDDTVSNGFVATIGDWPPGAGGGWGTTVIDGSVTPVLTLINSNDKCPSGQPRKTAFIFTCDEANLVGKLEVSQAGDCAYAITVPTKLACHALPRACGVTVPNGQTFDFSALTSATSYTVTDAQNHYEYQLNFCSVVTIPFSKYCTGAVCQYDLTQNVSFVNNYGFWPPSPEYGWTWTIINNTYVPQLELAGDAGQFGPRRTQFTFLCDADAALGDMTVASSPTVPSLVLVSVPSKYACVQ